jgi:hypothetical protein
VVPDCQAKRLPNVTLTGNARSGALGPVTESLDGILSFDQALAAAWREDAQAGDTVQVVLGWADPRVNHWDSKQDLFYAVKWTGVCAFAIGGGRPDPAHPHPTWNCAPGLWSTVIDAHTGGFIVGGTG